MSADVCKIKGYTEFYFDHEEESKEVKHILKVSPQNLTDTTDSLLVGFPRMLFFFEYAREPECELGQ